MTQFSALQRSETELFPQETTDREASNQRRSLQTPGSIRFFDYRPTPADVRAEVLEGLGRPAKRLSPKLFYDQRGSQLFDAITELPEYYPTRTEIGILREYGSEMADLIGRDNVLIELGSGSSLKIQTLLAALQPSVYMPVDISKEHLLESAHALAERFPGLSIRAACADYSAPFKLPMEPDWTDLAAFFPGSSIGNFDPDDARLLLGRVAELLGTGGRLLIGVDLPKDPAILNAAYDDAQGVTAAFNLNLLTRINRELEGNFDLDAFTHRAFFDTDSSRVEMHLVSRVEQRAEVAGSTFDFRAGETIHTENSYKYGIDHFHRLAGDAGFVAEQVWTDKQGLFSVHCLRVENGSAG
ncbi:L-histidine N(alpha)-methyltransferase [Thiocapsa roseopersicina]|uniref:Dimethylhistidine N-methyltransferase n=1 Tax=Thiocapsa roseopersicina TaxID=1058 RepID=A0A1H2TKM6_THIRO|nr:L-histidine N(alpha)-methyltransferase [Thiocapsa roseopersicina]SDW44566.1 dimethylhistidine N-methyltransferase [Thiocapsa roseopersicina]